MKKLLILAVLVICVNLSRSFAQTSANQKEDAPKEKASSDSRVPSATALGDIFFKSQNSLIFSLGVQESATDNLYFSPAGALTGLPITGNTKGYIPFTTLSGRMAYQRKLQRTTFGLDYDLSGMLFRSNDSGDFLSQSGGLDLSHQLSPRATFSIGDRISVSPAPGRFYRHDLVLAPVAEQILPNDTLFVGLNQTIMNAAFTSFSYQLSKRSQIALTANGTISRFQRQGLSDMNQSGGRLNYSYQASERTTVNLGYYFGYYDFTAPQTTVTSRQYTGIARSHLAYVGITRQLSSSVSAFVQAGPNYIVGDALSSFGGGGRRPGIRASVNGGLTFGKAISLDPRTSLSINAGQSISDGNGLGGMTQTQSAGFSVGHRLTKTLTGSVLAQYSRNQFLLSLDASGRPITTEGVSAGAKLAWNVTEKVNFLANYVHFRQVSSGFLTLIPGNASGNTFTLALNYSFPVFF